ncbi:hypothetical protein GPUN_2455 [Glaciecola punicea ACAM 611]|uniref:DUF4919 domain-containing protein n=1 Tax=Glaciecola punicea ACAM 611 TaxID=1121923 RepID=H5TE43_9ALTE|nr:DUF4919 domain-containing protein [Glaciecola punicea]OFA31106.1 DUF4919 domain-containing protein [Glaciecola punicea]GAB56570.1 hypothetical protein GPUN_2455 [Glaciecola punicea ACAM 611]
MQQVGFNAIRPLWVLAVLLFLYGCAATGDNAKVLNYTKSDTDYYAIIDKINNHQAHAADYDRIIQLYPLTSLYRPRSDDEQRFKLLSQAYMQNGQWQQCLNINNELLATNYTSLTGHYGVAICAAESGNIALGRFHNAILDNFIEAIWRTGSGQSPESPFYITSVSDIYAFIQLHQLVAVGQSLTYINNLPIQAIRVQNPETNRSLTWYFNVTPQFRRGVIDQLENTP